MSPVRILLTDDEAYVTTTLSSKFRVAGCEVMVGHDGMEGLELARTHLPQIIVTDFQMPVMSGFEMACALAADPTTCHIPVIMLTARAHFLTPEQLAKTNIKHLIDKPFSARDVVARVMELLAARVAA